MRGSKSIAPNNSLDESQHDPSSDDESQTTNDWWFTSWVLAGASLFVSALLFLQFGVAFYTSPVQAKTGLDWYSVNYSIVHYVFTTVLYRLSVEDYGMSCAATLLLPDFLTLIMMCLLHFDKIIAAFFLLLGSMFCLGVFVIASTIRLLWIARALLPPMTTCPISNNCKTNSL
jgi:hypothetical protein